MTEWSLACITPLGLSCESDYDFTFGVHCIIHYLKHLSRSCSLPLCSIRFLYFPYYSFMQNPFNKNNALV